MPRKRRSHTLHSLVTRENSDDDEAQEGARANSSSTLRKPRSHSQNDVNAFFSGTKPSSSKATKSGDIDNKPLLFGKKIIPGEGIYEGFMSFDGIRCGRGCMKGFRGSISFTKNCSPRGKKNLKYQYDGEWKDDLQHGYGIHLFFESGDRFEGHFVRGRREGRGLFLWGNGDKYTGDFERGMMHGLGRFEWANGDVYQGMWREGKVMGEGLMLGGDGSECEGSFFDGQLHGWAKKIWVHGDSFHGYFDKDIMSRFGTYEWREGHRYEGCWRENKTHGVGQYLVAVNSSPKNTQVNTYMCEYRDGLQCGLGFAEAEDGSSRYVGEVIEIAESSSLCTDENQTVWGRISYENGLRYDGDCIGSSKHGYGTLCFDKILSVDIEEKLRCVNDQDWLTLANMLQSQYLDLMASSAHFDFSSLPSDAAAEDVLLDMGGQFVGHFRSDQPHGMGRFLLSNGQCEEVEFRDGVLVRH